MRNHIDSLLAEIGVRLFDALLLHANQVPVVIDGAVTQQGLSKRQTQIRCIHGIEYAAGGIGYGLVVAEAKLILSAADAERLADRRTERVDRG